MNQDTLYLVCQDVLGVVVDYYAANPGNALPARRYVAAGPPAADCALLAVSAARLFPQVNSVIAEGLENLAAAPGWAMVAVQVQVTVFREAAVPEARGSGVVIPTVDQEQDAARAVYRDAVLCGDALRWGQRQGRIGSCGSVSVDGWQVIEPQGGIVGGILVARIGLE